jgi:hypothetical protein
MPPLAFDRLATKSSQILPGLSNWPGRHRILAIGLPSPSPHRFTVR